MTTDENPANAILRSAFNRAERCLINGDYAAVEEQMSRIDTHMLVNAPLQYHWFSMKYSYLAQAAIGLNGIQDAENYITIAEKFANHAIKHWQDTPSQRSTYHVSPFLLLYETLETKAGICSSLGRHDEALMAHNNAISQLRVAQENDPSTDLERYSNTYDSTTVTLLIRAGKLDEAITFGETITKKHAASRDPLLTIDYLNLAIAYEKTNQRDKAIKYAEESLRSRLATPDRHSPVPIQNIENALRRIMRGAGKLDGEIEHHIKNIRLNYLPPEIAAREVIAHAKGADSKNRRP